MNLYQQELFKKVLSYDCVGNYDAQKKRLVVSYKNKPFVEQCESGFLYYNQENLSDPQIRDIFAKILHDGENIREYVGIYMNAPAMPFEGIKQYKKFGEYNDVVFGATYNPMHGFMFSSWRVSGNGVHLGEYSSNYNYSKEYFALRSGLVNKQKIFTNQENEEIYKSVKYAKENCDSLSYEQENILSKILDKLTDVYPALEETNPGYESSENQQFNM